MIVGLVGPSGSGKSELAARAAGSGWFVIDADRVAREVTNRPAIQAALAEAFGADILPGGVLDRALLASRAFSSPENTERLNRTVLPTVTEAIREKYRQAGERPILLDAPTLLETELTDDCDAVLALLSDRPRRLARVLARDGIDPAAAEQRLDAARPDGYFLARATHVLFNNGTLADFLREADTMLLSLISTEKGSQDHV